MITEENGVQSAWPSILAAITGAFTSGVLGFLLAQFTQRRSMRIVRPTIFSFPILGWEPSSSSNLSITVDESALTGESSDRGHTVQLKDAYAFEVQITNVGKLPVEQCTVQLSLDSSAKIVDFSLSPSGRPGFDIHGERDPERSHVLRVVVPFINPKRHIIIRLVSTGNTQDVCNVEVLGLGVHVKRYSQLTRLVAAVLLLIGSMAYQWLLRALLDKPEYVHQAVLTIFRATIVQETHIQWPLWFRLLTAVPAVIAVVFALRFVFPKFLAFQLPADSADYDDVGDRLA